MLSKLAVNVFGNRRGGLVGIEGKRDLGFGSLREVNRCRDEKGRRQKLHEFHSRCSRSRRKMSGDVPRMFLNVWENWNGSSNPTLAAASFTSRLGSRNCS